MRTASIGKLIDLSINRTKLILFQPFSLKKWLCLLLIAFLAGALGHGSNGGNNSHRSKKAQAAQDELIANDYEVRAEDFENFENADEFFDFDNENSYPKHYNQADKPSLSSFPKPATLVMIFLILIPFIILFAWLSARFKFIWFDSIVKNDASIAGPFKKYKKEGDSLFEFILLLLLISIVFFGLLVIWIFAAGKTIGLADSDSVWSFGKVIGTFLIPGLIGIAGIISLILIYLAINQFIVPIMAIENCLFRPAWNKFLNIFKNNQKEFWFYILILIGLGITCAIIAIAVALICLIPLLLVAAILFGIPYLLLKMSFIFIGYAIIVGIPFLALTFIILLSIGLPVAVFFKSLSLYFFSSIECEYNPLPLE
ncbi:MAG: hypothetical protein K9L86_06810 [Candidatus Omnitrophica bacterium]|nr:hypothetical protein [Candidatus Omnitrophota bacterium]